MSLELKLPEAQASTFVLYCLSATVGCVVEKAVVLANQTNGDLGNAWLKIAQRWRRAATVWWTGPRPTISSSRPIRMPR